MALHLLNKRCDECYLIYSVRRPNKTLLISQIVPKVLCPHCHPEALEGMCGGCHLPLSVVGHHSAGLCNPCAVRHLRYKRLATATL